MSILVLVEHESSKISIGTYSTINAAQKLGNDIHALVVGYQCDKIISAVSEIDGVNKVLYVDDVIYQHILAETIVPLVKNIADSYTHILAPASSFGHNIMPRLAGVLQLEQISDVVEIVSHDVFVRPIYAGSAFVKIKLFEPIKLLTIRTTAFISLMRKQSPATIISVNKMALSNKDDESAAGRISFVKKEVSVSERPELTVAKIVISAGRAIQSTDSFKVLENIAIKLNAAIGASRPGVDSGFVANNHLVGQTGKVVAPDLYIAVGISGAIQHIAGMKDSKVIVAINKDPDAPIFKIADYGLVGDVFHLLPELDQALEKIKLETTV